MSSKNTCTDELSEGACAVTQDFTVHNDKKCGAAHLARLCHMTCQTRQQSARRCRCNRRQRHEASLSARARALRARIQTGGGCAFQAYLIAHTSCGLALGGTAQPTDLRNTSPKCVNAQGAELQKGLG